jgi:hypothetical protein
MIDPLVNHNDSKAAQEAFLNQAVEATETSQWMGVVFSLHGDKLRAAYTTSNFPKVELLNAVERLRELINRELSPPAPEPLSVAARFRDQIIEKSMNGQAHAESEGAG